MGPLGALLENPVFAIFAGIGVMVFIIKIGDAIHARALRHPTPSTPAEVPLLKQQMEALHAELRELRDTATQHAMSLDRNVELLTQRLNQVEGQVGKSNQVQQRLGGPG